MKVISVVGARPQFIKAAAVSRALRARGDVAETLLHTGQHYDANMSEVFFAELEIPRPDYQLGIGSGPHGSQTGHMLEAIERVLMENCADIVLVYGDTNSTLAGALAAVKLHVPIAHVEAGLRSFNRRMPEEINRIVVDHISTLLFAPTDAAVRNLVNEGIHKQTVVCVGDVMYDVALLFAQRAEACSRILEHYSLGPKGYVLATIHRAENTDGGDRLRIILEALGHVAQRLPVILPLHPRTRAAADRESLLQHRPSTLTVIDPVGYLDMVRLERNAAVIATDSGGVQKEAYFHRVPCVTLREETEWAELLRCGANRLCPPRSSRELAEAIESCIQPGFPADVLDGLYGDGTAATRIAAALASV